MTDITVQDDNKFCSGYHQFATYGGDASTGAVVKTGSFEVWHVEADSPEHDFGPGWYWWPCFPGCLPDGEANGPFPTAEGAYLDAIGD